MELRSRIPMRGGFQGGTPTPRQASPVPVPPGQTRPAGALGSVHNRCSGRPRRSGRPPRQESPQPLTAPRRDRPANGACPVPPGTRTAAPPGSGTAEPPPRIAPVPYRCRVGGHDPTAAALLPPPCRPVPGQRRAGDARPCPSPRPHGAPQHLPAEAASRAADIGSAAGCRCRGAGSFIFIGS